MNVTRQGGALLLRLLCALVVAATSAGAQTALPAGWSHADVGGPVVPGNAASTSSGISVAGAGIDVGGLSDEFHYAYQRIAGDVDIRVRASALQNVDAGAKAGLMIRESMADNARHAFMFVSAGQGLVFQRRTKAGRASVQTSGAATPAPVWLRLVRQGSTFSAYSSSTGTTWTLLASTSLTMNATAYVGLAVTSHVPSLTATATFTNLSFAGGLPVPWANADIGAPAMTGSSIESGGSFNVKGAGVDIWDASDQFQFAYQPMTGDAQIVAYVASLQSVDEYSKAGVMMRSALTASAPNAYVRVTQANGWRFNRRLAAGGMTVGSGDAMSTAPGWVRLVREGNLFTAYQSQDGSTWTLLGTDTIAMPATIYVGLAVTSKITTAVATAAFSNVAISVPTAANKPPTVSLTTPTVGAAFTTPASVALVAAAADVDGSVTKVDFYADATLVGSATSSPFVATWSNVAAGTYNVTAVATDNAGATATSPSVSISVGATNAPPAVSLTSPAPGASMTAPATVNLTASATDTDGTVAKVEFYAGSSLVGSATASPFSTTWSNVAAGTYSLTAVATDNSGATTTSGPVSVTIAANKAPTVSLTAPVAGAPFTAPASITMTAAAADTDGTVAKVEFYAGATLVGSDASSPYSVTWNNVAAGTYNLTAVATDNTGATTTSATVSITVSAANKAPTVALTTPLGGASFTAPASVTISAAATDVDGTVAKVDFYAGATLVGSDTSSPFGVTWNNVAAGTYSLTAVATDNSGATTGSAPVAITVAVPVNQLPTVSLTSPVTGTAFTGPATIAVSAVAADTDGTVSKVDFYAGAVLVGSDTSSPYSVTWSNVAAGTYSLTAVATDSVGGKSTSTAVSITVAPAPVVPSTLLFVPATDYATNVTSCTVELRRSGDALSAAPVASRSLGKPALVGSEISVDISSLVDPLAAGSYYAVIVTVGPGGSTSSAPSGTFTK